MTYKCAVCSGPVTKRNAEIPGPEVKGRKSRMMRGLGTWRCKTCPYYRQVEVRRFIGSGKESERDQMDTVFPNRHIKVKRTN
jgi:hypothetical protein